MGSGSKFHGALSTKGGSQGLGGANSAQKEKWSKEKLIKELVAKGVKINPKETLFVTKDKTGKIIWLEKGDLNKGLKHILDGNGIKPGHAADFQKAFGVSRGEVPSFIKMVVTDGKLVSSKTVSLLGGRFGYERVYYYKGNYHLVSGIGTNGFIVSAYPIRIKK